MSNQCSVSPTSPVEDFKEWPKLRVDLSTCQSVSRYLNEPDQIDRETARLINKLLTRLGVLMEDASTTALLSDSCGGSLAERVRLLAVEITRMHTISDAAMTLLNG